jgi:hypothetical protein
MFDGSQLALLDRQTKAVKMLRAVSRIAQPLRVYLYSFVVFHLYTSNSLTNGHFVATIRR